jgi:hypothetical protein
MRTRPALWLSVVLLGGLALVGCDFLTGSDRDEVQNRIRDRIEDRREQWDSQGIDSYEFTYSQQVGTTVIDTVKIFVREGAVDSIYTDPSTPDEDLLVGSIDSFFNLIESRVGQDDTEFGAEFNEEQGYPTQYTASFPDNPNEAILTLSLTEIGTDGS